MAKHDEIRRAAQQLNAAELPIRPIDPNSPVPLYHQVENDLRGMMQSGVILPDDLLPPEVELSKAYSVGRQTIRMALSRLVASQMISRQAGRGTVMLSTANRTHFYLDRSFTRQMAELGKTAHSRVLQADMTTIGANAPKALREHQGEPALYLERLRFGDDLPVGIQHTTILTAHCPDIERHDFSRASLYDVLARQYQLQITRITHTVTALSADVTQAKLLQIEAGDALLRVKTTAYLDNHDVIETSVSDYRTDKYEFNITQSL